MGGQGIWVRQAREGQVRLRCSRATGSRDPGRREQREGRARGSKPLSSNQPSNHQSMDRSITPTTTTPIKPDPSLSAAYCRTVLPWSSTRLFPYVFPGDHQSRQDSAAARPEPPPPVRTAEHSRHRPSVPTWSSRAVQATNGVPPTSTSSPGRTCAFTFLFAVDRAGAVDLVVGGRVGKYSPSWLGVVIRRLRGTVPCSAVLGKEQDSSR